MPKIIVFESIHPTGMEAMREYAEVEEFLNKSREERLAKIPEADAIVCKSVTRVDHELIDAAVKLKVVGRAGTGTDNFDKEYLRQKGIPLFNVPTGNTVCSAEFAVMLILLLSKRLTEALGRVGQGDFRRDLLEHREISKMSIGVVGFGNVGREVAKRLKPFGCEVVIYHHHQGYAADIAASNYVFEPDFKAFMGRVDLITLHASLTTESERMIRAETLAWAKPGLYVVNTARGKLWDDVDMLAALDSGQVAVAAVDTLSPEPPYNAPPGTHDYTHPLLNHPRVVVTPHMAASAHDAQQTIALELAERIRGELVSEK